MTDVASKDFKISLLMVPQWNLSQPPLGLACLTSCLRAKGFLVSQEDLSIELLHKLPEEKRNIMEEPYHLNWIHKFHDLVYPDIKDFVDEWVARIVAGDANVIGFSVFTVNRCLAILMSKMIKERAPQKIIIFGGPQVSTYEEDAEILESEYVDYIVAGEGEDAFTELLTVIANKGDAGKVKGIMLKKGGRMVYTGDRPLVAPLDALPFPDFSDFPLSQYKGLTIPILGSRGCINRCSFCSEYVLWKLFRYRSGENLYREFKYQVSVTKAQSFYMVDSLINGNVRELEAMCDFIIQDSDLKFYWGGKVSIRAEMTLPLLKKMYLAGCRSLGYGLESGSPKVLKDMNKRFTLELAERVIRDTHEAGISVGIFWVIGFPTEDESDFQQSIDFLNRVKDHVTTVTPGYGCGILKGSQLSNHSQDYGITYESDGWHSESTTPAIREDRIKRFKDECRRLNLSTG